MNISYKWLKEYVDFDLTPQQTADALTSCGLEVDALEEVQTVKGGLKGLYVGKVLTCEMHPNSDHLHVTTVDLGKGEPQQIVCGAPNVQQDRRSSWPTWAACSMTATRSLSSRNRNCAASRASA